MRTVPDERDLQEWLDLAKNAYDKAKTMHDTATDIAEKLESRAPTIENPNSPPKTRDYHEFLIKSLQDPEERAGYVEIVLEEGGDEPRLLPKVLSNVVEAYRVQNEFPESARQRYDRLLAMLAESGGAEIYALVEFLQSIDLQVRIAVNPSETPDS